MFCRIYHHHHHHHQSLNYESCWGTTDYFAPSFLLFSLLSTALLDLPNSRPVHSLILSSHLFLCLPCLLPPFTMPCKIVLARPDEQETWPYHCSLRLFTIIRRSSCGPINCLLDLGTDFLIGNMVFVWDVWYLVVAPHFHGLYSSLELCCEGPWFTSMWENGCDKGVHQSYLGAERNTPVIPNWFQPCHCCCCRCCPEEYVCVWQIKWNQSAEDIHNFIRGNDKVPGAWTTINGEVSDTSLHTLCCTDNNSNGDDELVIQRKPLVQIRAQNAVQKNKKIAFKLGQYK